MKAIKKMLKMKIAPQNLMKIKGWKKCSSEFYANTRLNLNSRLLDDNKPVSPQKTRRQSGGSEPWTVSSKTQVHPAIYMKTKEVQVSAFRSRRRGMGGEPDSRFPARAGARWEQCPAAEIPAPAPEFLSSAVKNSGASGDVDENKEGW